MKLRTRTIKHRSCDDWYEDESPYYQIGTAYGLSDDAPRFRSASQAAHDAMRTTSRPTIGFHKPRGDQ